MPGSPLLSTKPASTEQDTLWWVYLLHCVDGSLYCGITTQVERRLAEHNGEGKSGARYTRSRRPVRVVYRESWPDRASAARREAQLKRLPRSKKQALAGLPPD